MVPHLQKQAQGKVGQLGGTHFGDSWAREPHAPIQQQLKADGVERGLGM